MFERLLCGCTTDVSVSQPGQPNLGPSSTANAGDASVRTSALDTRASSGQEPVPLPSPPLSLAASGAAQNGNCCDFFIWVCCSSGPVGPAPLSAPPARQAMPGDGNTATQGNLRAAPTQSPPLLPDQPASRPGELTSLNVLPPPQTAPLFIQAASLREAVAVVDEAFSEPAMQPAGWRINGFTITELGPAPSDTPLPPQTVPEDQVRRGLDDPAPQPVLYSYWFVADLTPLQPALPNVVSSEAPPASQTMPGDHNNAAGRRNSLDDLAMQPVIF